MSCGAASPCCWMVSLVIRRSSPPKNRAKSSLPLGYQSRGNNDKRPLYEAELLHFAQVYPGHDRLARAWLISQQEPQLRLGEHRSVDRV